MQYEDRTEYRVYNEVGEIYGECSTLGEAQDLAEIAKNECETHFCGTDGQEETPGRGDFKCGVLSEHGIHIDEVEGDYILQSHL